MKRTTLLLAALLHGWLLTSAGAATYTWTGTGFLGSQDYLWSNDFNWAGNVGPAPGETNVALIFPNNTAPKFTTNDLVGLSVVSIWFAGSNYVIHGKPGGNPLNLQGNPGGGWVVLATYNGSQFASTCPISLNTTGTVAVASGATLTMNSQLFGAGGFTKTSPGTLKLQASAANLFSGLTLVTDGTLDLNTTGNAIAGPLVIGDTNLSSTPIVRLLADNQIGNSSPVRVNESGQLWLNSHDDTVGAMTLVSGAQVFTGFGPSGSLPGLLTLNGNVTNLDSGLAQVAEITGRLDLGGATRVFHANNWLRLWCAISGAGGVTKTGFGTLGFSQSTNSYTGTTAVQQGLLHVYEGATPLGTTGNGTTVAAFAELYVEGANLGAEPLTLNGGGSNFTVLAFRGTNFSSGPVTLNDACRFDSADWGDPADPVLNLGGAVGGSGSLRKTGSGHLEFSGLGGNTFTGGLFCEAGWVLLNKSASAPAFSGPLVVGRDGIPGNWVFVEIAQINQIPNSMPITLLDYGSLSTLTATETIGPLELHGGLLYAGGGAFTLSGDITNHPSALMPGIVTGDILLPATRVVNCDAGSVLQWGGNLGGSGGVTKTGAGELSFYGPHTYSGSTLVKEGTLTLTQEGRPGSTAASTTIEANAALYLDGVGVTNESLVLYGGGADNGVALIHHNTNVWSGPVEIHNGAAIKAEPTAKLSIGGAITGDGGLTHFGDGRLILGGTTANSFTGPTTFRLGTLELSKPNGIAAIPDSLTIGYSTNGAPGAMVKCNASGQFAPAGGASLVFNSVSVNPSSTLDCNGFNQSVPNLNLVRATVQTGGGVLTLLGDLTVGAVAGSSSSYLLGNLELASGLDASHSFDVGSNAVIWCSAVISEAGGTQNIAKWGAGQWLGLSDVNITGDLHIQAGRWYASGANPFGTAAAPTIVDAGASLFAFSGTFGEPLQLSGSGDEGVGALYSASTNSFTGPITLTADTTIFTSDPAILSLAGPISSAGKLTKAGPGLLQLSGADANTYSGGTLVAEGRLELAKNGALAIPGDLSTLANTNTTGVRLMSPNQFADVSAIQLAGTTYLDLNGNSDSIGSIAGTGSLLLGAGTLTTGGNHASTSFGGSIVGSGGLTKTGSGTFSLTAQNTYTGTTTVNGGTLLVMGQQPSSPVSVLTGGTLGGKGRVGHISDLNGNVSPGTSPGILTCSNYSTFTPANLLQIEIAGATPGSGYDQLQVNGTILLMGGTLQVAMNFSGAISNQYVIINNDGADLVSGTFTGLPEGAMLTNNGVSFQITYHGGDGNDVVLTQKSVVTGPAITSAKIVGGKFQLNATSQPGLTYTVEATSSLTPPVPWTAIGTALADGAGLIQFVDADSNLYPVRFYRLRFP